jgi:MFS superfamily sulfate permease-like transporter
MWASRSQLKAYEWRTTLGSDLVAGLTVGVMVVPQSMCYAKLAGLPVGYCLYSGKKDSLSQSQGPVPC